LNEQPAPPLRQDRAANFLSSATIVRAFLDRISRRASGGAIIDEVQAARRVRLQMLQKANTEARTVGRSPRSSPEMSAHHEAAVRAPAGDHALSSGARW